ncbi:MAG: serine hydrolase [Bacteroidales bacterium]|nr:serine hydrolase [Candidatus Cryptobacteroides caccocaballi]
MKFGRKLSLIIAAVSAAAMISCNCQTETVCSPYSYDDGLPRSTPEAQGVPSEAIAQAFKAIKDGGYETHGVMILRHGNVIAEHWWAPYAPDVQHAMYSATKTFTGTAVGFAVQEGLLKVSDRVMDFFPELLPETVPAGLEKLTVEHLLTMSCGHAVTQYPGSGTDQIRSFLATEFKYEPGESFAYDITCSHMLSRIITKVTGITIKEYLEPRLLDKLGIKDVVWEMDLDGCNMGNGGSHMRTSDLAKLGLFLINGGKWDGEQLLNPEWIAAMTTPHIYQHPERSEEENAGDDGAQGYGYQTWMGRCGSYRAIGGQNQLCLVIPDYDVVIAVHSQVRDENGFNTIMYKLCESMSDKPLKASGFDLASEIAGYELARPFTSSSAGLRSTTRRYEMEKNSLGINAVSFRFDKDGNCTVTMEEAASVHNLNFGLDSWMRGSTDRTMTFARAAYKNTMNSTPVNTAGLCAWTGEDELSAYWLSMFNVGAAETLVFNFNEKGMAMTIKGMPAGLTINGTLITSTL